MWKWPISLSDAGTYRVIAVDVPTRVDQIINVVFGGRKVTHSTRAKIFWIPHSEGGRERTPTGLQYTTVERFKDPAADWSADAWSVVVRFLENRENVEVRFLAEDAPHRLLQPGTAFELYEGYKKVADVRVL